MKIIWSERALTDLREIRNWIAADSPTYALRMVERIVRQAELLENLPRRGHAVPEAQNSDILEVHAEPYRIIYKVSPESVGILTIVHMARNIGSYSGDERA
ncbi:MAG: type II toxin-antitoxin system RelE/ParE family toxin [Pontiellaceae bacterium]|nr:type II toxin-antitoxin system RelE/ParE family toxin [Pontiellaceae bacterium]